MSDNNRGFAVFGTLIVVAVLLWSLITFIGMWEEASVVWTWRGVPIGLGVVALLFFVSAIVGEKDAK